MQVAHTVTVFCWTQDLAFAVPRGLADSARPSLAASERDNWYLVEAGRSGRVGRNLAAAALASPVQGRMTQGYLLGLDRRRTIHRD